VFEFCPTVATYAHAGHEIDDCIPETLKGKYEGGADIESEGGIKRVSETKVSLVSILSSHEQMAEGWVKHIPMNSVH
jgi:hypothetical protein